MEQKQQQKPSRNCEEDETLLVFQYFSFRLQRKCEPEKFGEAAGISFGILLDNLSYEQCRLGSENSVRCCEKLFVSAFFGASCKLFVIERNTEWFM